MIKKYKEKHQIKDFMDLVTDQFGGIQVVLLQETEQHIEELVKEGLSALNAQILIVDQNKNPIKALIKGDPEGNTPDFWQQFYRQTVKRQWLNSRIRLVTWANTSRNHLYKGLFGEVTVRINEILRDAGLQSSSIEDDSDGDHKEDDDDDSKKKKDPMAFVRLKIVGDQTDRVSFDGQPPVETPTTIEDIKPGEYTLRIVATEAPEVIVAPDPSEVEELRTPPPFSRNQLWLLIGILVISATLNLILILQRFQGSRRKGR